MQIFLPSNRDSPYIREKIFFLKIKAKSKYLDWDAGFEDNMITRQVWKPFVYAYQPLQVILRERWYQVLAGFKKQPQKVFSVHSAIWFPTNY